MHVYEQILLYIMIGKKCQTAPETIGVHRLLKQSCSLNPEDLRPVLLPQSFSLFTHTEKFLLLGVAQDLGMGQKEKPQAGPQVDGQFFLLPNRFFWVPGMFDPLRHFLSSTCLGRPLATSPLKMGIAAK